MRRVVVTGLGAISPCGPDVVTTWRAVIEGRSGIARIRGFDCSTLPVRIGGEVPDPDPRGVVGARSARRMDRFTIFARVAAHEAMVDAGFDPDRALGDRAGVYIGTGVGGLGEMARGTRRFDEGGYRELGPFFVPRLLTNLGAGQVAIAHGARGPSLCPSTACASGSHALGEAWRAIRAGDADVILAGGAEAAVSPIGIAGFAAMKALSRRNDDPAGASRPFDRGRDGFVMSEGAGVVVLEEREHAVQRGARIYAELVGYGSSTDAHHITAPPPRHAGAARSMRAALRSAGLPPTAVDHVNAHGTSTRSNDLEETRALHDVFGAHAPRLAVSATKSVTGHMLGASGGVEAVLTALALHHGVVPPTINLEDPDPECDLDYVPDQARELPIRVALSNAFGFGGTNATLLFRHHQG